MRYTFPYKETTKTVNISDEWIKKTKINLNLSTSEAIELWLCDNGYEENLEQKALNEKAKQNRVLPDVDRKTRKAPTRKPDEVKRELIRYLAECLGELETLNLKDVECINIERIITFSLGDDKYELTLSKKRRPKD